MPSVNGLLLYVWHGIFCAPLDVRHFQEYLHLLKSCNNRVMLRKLQLLWYLNIECLYSTYFDNDVENVHKVPLCL